jgi:hypothetical protein
MLYTWIKNYLHKRYLERKDLDEKVQRWKDWEQKLFDSSLYPYKSGELEAYYEEWYKDNKNMFIE